MKQDEIRDRVITNIAKACPNLLNRDVVTLADQILSIEGIAILAKDQNLPRVYAPTTADGVLDESFARGVRLQREAFIKEGFRRVIAKRE